MTPQSGRSWHVRSWHWIALIWISLGLANGTQVVVGMRAVGMRHQWGALFFVWAAAWLVWACATPLVLHLGRHFPPTRASGWRGWSAHLGLWFAIDVADALWIGALYRLFNPLGGAGAPDPWLYEAFGFFYQRSAHNVVTYAAILAIGYAMDSLQRLSLREAELSKAQLDALRRQMEPHFLFNTLNGIAALVREQQNQAAVQMIAGLSDLLRRVLEGGDRQLVPLAEELSFLERYVELQLMRFGDRLHVTVEVPPQLYGALVPPLILQPLVENAIVHGIGKSVDGGTIHVGASERAGVLTLYVHNDGPALPAEAPESPVGVGISNTRGRLRSLYGAASALELRNHERSGVETIVRVPCRRE